MKPHTSTRLNTLTCVLRFLLGRQPTHAEKVRVYARLFWRRKPAWQSFAGEAPRQGTHTAPKLVACGTYTGYK
jgi:hypothetical protein